jgi:hypothetical protein
MLAGGSSQGQAHPRLCLVTEWRTRRKLVRAPNCPKMEVISFSPHCSGRPLEEDRARSVCESIAERVVRGGALKIPSRGLSGWRAGLAAAGRQAAGDPRPCTPPYKHVWMDGAGTGAAAKGLQSAGCGEGRQRLAARRATLAAAACRPSSQ